MNDLNEQDKKRLQDYLDECKTCYQGTGIKTCHELPSCHTFTTLDDMVALKDKMVEKGDWEDFHYYCGQVCDCSMKPHQFTKWLINAPRFCWLVNEWLKEKETKT